MVVARVYGRLMNRNPVPSQARGAGRRRWKDIAKRGTLADPLSEAPTPTYLHQMAYLIAHALLEQGEEASPTVKRLGIARPSGSSTAPSTAGRRGETLRA